MRPIRNFFVNDQQYYTYEKITILEIIQYFNYNDALLVLEYNNLICNKEKWNEIFITNQDRIEIVTIVGGG